MARKKTKGTELSVFKGREAKLNHAIFNSLAIKGNQSIYDLHKNITELRGFKRIHYGNVNKRVRSLDKAGYVKIANTKNTKAGFLSAVYELTPRAYLSLMLNTISLEEILARSSETLAYQLTAAIIELIQ
jgi:DNA-binding PadR family transcriptional regulator